MTTKAQLRSEIATKRKALDAQWLASASRRVAQNLQSLDAFQSAETVALYMAITGEVQLDTLFPRCWTLGKRTCIPVFNANLKMYEMAEITKETRFETGHYGIQEPVSPSILDTDSIDLIVVPGVAFDAKGHRLGRGGGYYDRLLDGFPGETTAVAFDFQILPAIPTHSHDMPVDAIATETKTVEVQNEH